MRLLSLLIDIRLALVARTTGHRTQVVLSPHTEKCRRRFPPSVVATTVAVPVAARAGREGDTVARRGDVQAGTDASGAGAFVLKQQVEAVWPALSAAERKVGDALAHCAPEELVFATALDIADRAGTSDATVVRMVRRLGYSGLPDLKRAVGEALTHGSPPDQRLQQRISAVGADIGTTAAKIYAEADERIDQIRECTDVEALGQAVRMLAQAPGAVAYGFGASELAARHLALKLNRLGQRSRFIGTTGFGLADELLSLGAGDVVVIYAPGRLLQEIEVIMERARDTQSRTILIAGRELVEHLRGRVDIALEAPQSASGATCEALTALLLTDVLLLGVAAIIKDRALYTSDTLSRLREQLLGPDARR